jgi:DNA-binding NarL/FixJ family response regulator
MIMTSSVLQPPTEPAPVHLTLVSRPALNARERQVLALVAEGHSTRDVARRLCYSERTIKNILQDVTVRLNLRNRTQAVAVAIRAGWI